MTFDIFESVFRTLAVAILRGGCVFLFDALESQQRHELAAVLFVTRNPQRIIAEVNPAEASFTFMVGFRDCAHHEPEFRASQPRFEFGWDCAKNVLDGFLSVVASESGQHPVVFVGSHFVLVFVCSRIRRGDCQIQLTRRVSQIPAFCQHIILSLIHWGFLCFRP